MLRIVEIVNIDDMTLTCLFSDGALKNIDMRPLLKKYQYLDGISKLYTSEIFNKVEIGQFGELVWRDLVKMKHNNEEQLWDYDVSPEFVYDCTSVI